MNPTDQSLATTPSSGSIECLSEVAAGSLLEKKEKQLKEIQDRIENYKSMVKVLANQREAAVKVLHDMDSNIVKLTKELEVEKAKVEAKDRELKTKRTQLQKLKDEEQTLKEKFNVTKEQLDSTSECLTKAQLSDSQVKNKIQELQEFLSTTNAAIDDIEKAISIKDTIKLSALCNQPIGPPPSPLSLNSLLTNGHRANSTTSNTEVQHVFDGHNRANENSDSMFNDVNYDPFANEDPFDGDDPFKVEDVNVALPEDDPFNPTSSSASSILNHAQNDPFAPPRPPPATGRGPSPLGF